MRQDSEVGRQKGGSNPCDKQQVLAGNLQAPPLESPKEGAGAPAGGFSYQLKKLRLRLSTQEENIFSIDKQNTYLENITGNI